MKESSGSPQGLKSDDQAMIALVRGDRIALGRYLRENSQPAPEVIEGVLTRLRAEALAATGCG